MLSFERAAATLPVGGRWVLDLVVTDDDGLLVDEPPTVTITRPDGSTTPAAASLVDAGRYRAAYTVTAGGRYTAVATSTYGAAAVAAYVVDVTTTAGMPVSGDLIAYMGPSSWTTEQIDDALAAEADAQRAVCRIGAHYPNDLRNALLRRAQRNLALRRLPLAVQTGDADTGPLLPPGRDPEVRRLEAPYRKLPIG